jgi:serine/threonine protein kinase
MQPPPPSMPTGIEDPDAADEGSLPQIGGFRVLRRLASGGTADIFLARAGGPHGFERVVVLKVLLARFRNDPAFERMFAREASAYARLSHPAIVRLFDFFSTDGQLVMVLEHVDGLPLNKLRAMLSITGDKLDDRASLFVASRVFAALAAAHAAKDPETGEFAPVIHRDINPSNVLVPWDGHVKLADFGIAKVTGMQGDTKTGFIKGTYGYMAPEQVRGETVTGRADVYAATLLLWELLTRRKAIQRGALPEVEVLKAMAKPQFPSLDSLRPELDAAVRDAVRRGLEPNADRRSITAEDMATILRGSIQGGEEARSLLVDSLARVRPSPSGELDVTTSGPRAAGLTTAETVRPRGSVPARPKVTVETPTRPKGPPGPFGDTPRSPGPQGHPVPPAPPSVRSVDPVSVTAPFPLERPNPRAAVVLAKPTETSPASTLPFGQVTRAPGPKGSVPRTLAFGTLSVPRPSSTVPGPVSVSQPPSGPTMPGGTAAPVPPSSSKAARARSGQAESPKPPALGDAPKPAAAASPSVAGSVAGPTSGPPSTEPFPSKSPGSTGAPPTLGASMPTLMGGSSMLEPPLAPGGGDPLAATLNLTGPDDPRDAPRPVAGDPSVGPAFRLEDADAYDPNAKTVIDASGPTAGDPPARTVVSFTGPLLGDGYAAVAPSGSSAGDALASTAISPAALGVEAPTVQPMASTVISPVPASPQEAAPPARRRSGGALWMLLVLLLALAGGAAAGYFGLFWRPHRAASAARGTTAGPSSAAAAPSATLAPSATAAPGGAAALAPSLPASSAPASASASANPAASASVGSVLALVTSASPVASGSAAPAQPSAVLAFSASSSATGTPSASQAPPAAAVAPTAGATPTVTAPAAGSAIPADSGDIVVASSGHRVYVDGRVVGQSPGTFRVKCGPRSVHIGSAQAPKTLNVPCGGTVPL